MAEQAAPDVKNASIGVGPMFCPPASGYASMVNRFPLSGIDSNTRFPCHSTFIMCLFSCLRSAALNLSTSGVSLWMSLKPRETSTGKKDSSERTGSFRPTLGEEVQHGDRKSG